MASSGYSAQSRETDKPTDKDTLNSFMLGGVGVQNLNGQVIENIKIPLNTEIAIPHSLGVVPKFRLVLRHIGGLQLVDGDTAWTDKTIYLKAIATNLDSSGNISGLTANYADTSIYFVTENIGGSVLTDTCSKVATNTVPAQLPRNTEGYITPDCLPDISVSGSVNITVTPSADEEITVSVLLLRG